MVAETNQGQQTRQEMIDRLLWNSGGYGLGHNQAISMAWAMSEPAPGEPDIKSIVAVCGPADKYTDEELHKLVEFSEERTARYDTMFRIRMGANLIIIDKNEGAFDPAYRWLRKRLTWEYGPMHSATLDEALEVMRKN